VALSYTREVKLDHGEESTVGGVTVQQYLAEVERTITDPTLTSTYKPRRLLNTVKNKIYYTLIASLEDVMTAINPPKQNTSGQFEVNFDGFTASAPLPKKLEAKILIQSIVRARAAFRTKHAGRSL
jgi:hypothetical protein